MDVGTVLSVAQTLFAALQCSELKEVLSVFGYKSQLEDLQRTVSTINAVFCDAETKEELTHEAQHWIEELKDAVFEADDLFDEFVTLAEQKQLVEAGGSLSKKLSHFFSRSHNPLSIAYKMSRGVKEIKKKLDAIANNSQQFGFKFDTEPIRKRRPESCSYVDAGDIIGRETDLDNIVGILLDSNVQRDVSFLTIVGIGGLGKTALAQLVYNDPRVTSAFPLRLWTCVSDQDQKHLDVKEVLGKILASATGKNHDQGFTMDQVQSQLREKLTDKRFLLVLDDVWTEKRDQWCGLVKYLVKGERGSWIVVTTRSQETSRIVGDGRVHELQGLSIDYSWRLFERMAFGSDQTNPPNDMVEIGREIVDGCARVPLAIRVVGSLLYGQNKSKWQSLRGIGLANMRKSDNDIMPILKLSYHQLESSLKSCFGYCALFPKDSMIEKEKLITLWMAQGYIIPFDEGQSIEDAGEEYFTILLRRCFFQDIKKDEFGEIFSFKIHDLMHDVAQNVTEKEICAAIKICGNLGQKVRHISFVGRHLAGCSFYKTRIRSYLHVGGEYAISNINQNQVEALVNNGMCLRALDLSRSRFNKLPESIGKLLHLRYINLSANPIIEVLPKSIIKLYNLQTLQLRWCERLKELPKDLNRLVNLRVLDIEGCDELTYMPRGMGELSCLHRLSVYKVSGEEGCSSSWRQWFDRMEDLKALNNLRGHLTIQIRWPKNAFKDDGKREGLYLRKKEHLSSIWFDFKNEDGDVRVDNEVTRRLMEDMHPHPNLSDLVVLEYPGMRMPSWVTLLPNLVELALEDCGELEYIPCLGNLPLLKLLQIVNLKKLEYIGEDSQSGISTSASPLVREVEGLSYYPSLETLVLEELPKFKGWRRRVGNNHLYQLKQLTIWRCLELICIPPCPSVEELRLLCFNTRVRILEGREKDENVGKSTTIHVPKLKTVELRNVAWLNSLPMDAFECLQGLSISVDDEVESLGEAGEVFRSCSSSLRELSIMNCNKLRSVSGGLEHLTALEVLQLEECANLMLSDEEDEKREDGISIGLMPWSSLHHSLRTLTLSNLPQLVNLPNWMQFLTALQSLNIYSCKHLESMPNWMPKLTSLSKLCIWTCSANFMRRCQQDPPGQDWPYIKHICHIEFKK